MRASVHPTVQMNRKPVDILGRAGYYQADASCVLLDGSWEALYASANTAIEAMMRVLEGRIRLTRFADRPAITHTQIRPAASVILITLPLPRN